ncbi:hypothetical protein [Xanthomonas phage JGB6]|nr:hypothetical protein [Xanthomonas phage JGB6]
MVMNTNMILAPGETILLMEDGSSGKKVSDTRVFSSMEDFREWIAKEVKVRDHESVYGKGTEVGDVLHRFTLLVFSPQAM